jgi:nucleoid-associated protein YgaU
MGMSTRLGSHRPSIGESGGVANVILLITALAVVTSGCGTGGLAVKKDVWEAQDTFERRQAGLSEKVLSLEGRIDALEADLSAANYRLEELAGEVGGMRSEFSRGLEAVRDGQQELGIELERRIREQGDARTKDRQDLLARMEIILEEVTAENRRLNDELAAVKSSVGVGYTHEVKAGESLARIAAKYGLTVAEVAAANDISNPDRISVGQELFIPEKR